MLIVSPRLEQVHPDLAADVRSLSPDRQLELASRVALEAARRTGLATPPRGSDLEQWSADLDQRGWARDASGEPTQDAGDFARARAACALRNAATAKSRTDAVEDSLYESIAAMGLDVVRELVSGAT